MTPTLTGPVEDWIDLERFPLTALDTPAGRRLVAESRARFEETGVALLDLLVEPGALEVMRAQAAALTGLAYFYESTHNAYLLPDDPTFPPGHPRRAPQETRVGSIAYDDIPEDAPLGRLYRWPPLREFIRRVLGKAQLYNFADPLGALSINVFKEGGKHGWHFDESEFSVTMMLQPAEAGGDFEFVTGLRPVGTEGYEAVGRVLGGDESGVQSLPFPPGSLFIFAGRRTLHRVSDTGGARPRLVPVLCFADAPGLANSDEVRRMFWGRVS